MIIVAGVAAEANKLAIIKHEHLTILGGGPAGLATGYFAGKAGMPFTIYEGQSRAGGNAITHEVDGFRFDSGAHRLHDKDPEMTKLWRSLLGEDLLTCRLPSRIFHEGMWVDFPLTPRNLLKVLPIQTLAKGACDLLGSRISGGRRSGDFETFAVYNYGREISQRFLLRYSEKLWGLPCNRLSTAISGARLKGLDLATFLLSAVRNKQRSDGHLDGSFLYPRRGIGMLAERLVAECGEENLQLGSRVTRILHDGVRVEAVEINRDETVPVQQVVSTLPLPVWLRLMDPAPKPELLEVAESLRFRHVILAGCFIKRSRVTDLGTVYFVDPQFPMTRVYEPKNRSETMAPADRTMLVAEIPCGEGDSIWKLPDDAVVDLVRPHFEALGWIEPGEFLGACVKRMRHAYPVLEQGIEEKLRTLADGLKGFTNLQFAGRNGAFQYAHLHDMMRFGQRAVARLAGMKATRPRADLVAS